MNEECKGPVFNLSSDEIERVQSVMRAGKSSNSGFLDEKELLMEVIKKDHETLQRLNITPKQIRDRLVTLYGKHVWNCGKTKSFADKSLVEQKYEITSVTYMGAQTCPFLPEGCKSYYGYHYGDSDVTIKNIHNNKEITYNTLLPHLILEHNFFEGNVSHRLDPVQVIETLELVPGEGYSPCYVEEEAWTFAGSRSYIDEETMSHLEATKKESFEIAEGHRGYIGPGFYDFEKEDEFLHVISDNGEEFDVKLVKGAKLSDRSLNCGITSFTKRTVRYIPDV